MCISSSTGRFSNENSLFIARRTLDRSNYTFYIFHFSPSLRSFFFRFFVLQKRKKNSKQSKERKIICSKIKLEALFGLINND